MSCVMCPKPKSRWTRTPWPDSFLTESFQLVFGGNLAFFHKMENKDTLVFKRKNASQRCPKGGGVLQAGFPEIWHTFSGAQNLSRETSGVAR